MKQKQELRSELDEQWFWYMQHSYLLVCRNCSKESILLPHFSLSKGQNSKISKVATKSYIQVPLACLTPAHHIPAQPGCTERKAKELLQGHNPASSLESYVGGS